jgi:hypothetical protein
MDFRYKKVPHFTADSDPILCGTGVVPISQVRMTACINSTELKSIEQGWTLVASVQSKFPESLSVGSHFITGTAIVTHGHDNMSVFPFKVGK